MKASHSQRGFTLVEMLIALVMAAIVVAPLYVITRSMSMQTNFQRMEAESMQRARTAMNLLIRDFSRAGLFTSPDTANDPRYINSTISGATSRFRAAVAHLNRNNGGNDSVIISGNLTDSRLFKADWEGTSFRVYSLQGDLTASECARLFPPFAFLNVTNKQGVRFDIAVSGVSHDNANGRCVVQIADNITGTGFLNPSDADLRVSVNRTAIYRVERGQLVRYFIDYDSPGSVGGGTCTDDNGALALNIGSLNVATRTILAEDVVDFQVWFRAKTEIDSDWNAPNYETLGNIIAANGSGDVYADGLLPPATWHVIPQNIAAGAPNNDDVSCNLDKSEVTILPESVRSAVIRLAIRTQEEDRQISVVEVDGGVDDRLVRRNLARFDANSAYKIKSLVTEIEMPNMAFRSDL